MAIQTKQLGRPEISNQPVKPAKPKPSKAGMVLVKLLLRTLEQLNLAKALAFFNDPMAETNAGDSSGDKGAGGVRIAGFQVMRQPFFVFFWWD